MADRPRGKSGASNRARYEEKRLKLAQWFAMNVTG